MGLEPPWGGGVLPDTLPTSHPQSRGDGALWLLEAPSRLPTRFLCSEPGGLHHSLSKWLLRTKDVLRSQGRVRWTLTLPWAYLILAMRLQGALGVCDKDLTQLGIKGRVLKEAAPELGSGGWSRGAGTEARRKS